MVPVVTQDSITISWPAPDSVEFVQSSTVLYTATSRAGQSSGRKKRQTDTFSGTIPVPGSQTSAQVTGSDLRPFYDYRFRVRANFGNGLVAEIVEPFNVPSAEARELLNSLYFGSVLSLLAYPLLLSLPIINLHIRMLCSNE